MARPTWTTKEARNLLMKRLAKSDRRRMARMGMSKIRAKRRRMTKTRKPNGRSVHHSDTITCSSSNETDTSYVSRSPKDSSRMMKKRMNHNNGSSDENGSVNDVVKNERGRKKLLMRRIWTSSMKTIQISSGADRARYYSMDSIVIQSGRSITDRNDSRNSSVSSEGTKTTRKRLPEVLRRSFPTRMRPMHPAKAMVIGWVDSGMKAELRETSSATLSWRMILSMRMNAFGCRKRERLQDQGAGVWSSWVERRLVWMKSPWR